MARFENTQGISLICFEQNIQCYCPLGNDWYTNHVEVSFSPTIVIPDYCEIDDFTRSLGGQALLIEDVVKQVYDYIADNYKPSNLTVTSHVNDAKHMPVTVMKQM